MYQIDVASAVTAPPASTAEGAPGFFTDGNPATGQAATIVPAEFLNAFMRELLNLLHAAQIKPDKAQFDQLTAAVKALAQVVGNERYARQATTLAGYGITDAVNVKEKGQAGGVATLNDKGQVPQAQLPARQGLADGEVTTPKLAPKAVTTDKLAPGAVTKDKLALFDHYIAPFGYQKLPSGLMMQWGYQLISGYGDTIYFPMAFPNACLRIVATDTGYGCHKVAAVFNGSASFIAYGKVSGLDSYGKTAYQYLALGY